MVNDDTIAIVRTLILPSPSEHFTMVYPEGVWSSWLINFSVYLFKLDLRKRDGGIS
jgi:hypothetical protein